ncbi:type IX secretion system membrane protein, PorP/SprF family [Flavobacterium swingsii]|uniref:Type IX secretion system membrane protein, PorP/SprF family n=1 Tax=Flavobacterium swingsii TaxID=498292 RepID=A0A1I0VGE4_9FLAO|nr:type IX secretion system membrane protein PorP/SprF [Flavobacterium swingsii]SFA74666.1 type IX secretion system membrane protein, PorP/SprF family [Flavobacterium swingsii]
MKSINSRKIFLTLVFMLLESFAYSQQDSQFTQYMYNTINVNPAYAGSRRVMSVFGLHRNQWVGLDGAPITNAFSLHSPIGDANLALGLSFVNDKIGVSNENSISIAASYAIQTSENYKLAFGINGAFNQLNINYNKLKTYDTSDVLLEEENNKFSPNIGAGLYFHSDKNYIGISVPNLLETKQYDDIKKAVANDQIHFYFITGYVFDLSSSVKLKPALLSKIVKGAPLQADLSANFLFNEKFTLGAAYRFSKALSAMAGFQISNSWFLGYAYDLERTKLASYNSGSHEIFLRYELFKEYKKFKSPRFF